MNPYGNHFKQTYQHDKCMSFRYADMKSFKYDFIPVPMDEEVFERIVPGIVRDLRDEKYCFLCIGYLIARPDRITCIQTCRQKVGYRLELIADLNDNYKFHIYAQDNVPYKDTVQMFREVCVDFETPDFMNWREVTELVNYGKKGTPWLKEDCK